MVTRSNRIPMDNKTAMAVNHMVAVLVEAVVADQSKTIIMTNMTTQIIDVLDIKDMKSLAFDDHLVSY